MVLKFNFKKIFIVLLSVLYCLLLFPLVPIYAEDEPVQGCPTEIVTDDSHNEYCMPEDVYNNHQLQDWYRNVIKSNVVTETDLEVLENIGWAWANWEDLPNVGTLEQRKKAMFDLMYGNFIKGTWGKQFQGAFNCMLGGNYRLGQGCIPEIQEAMNSVDAGDQGYKNYYTNSNDGTIFANGDVNYHNIYNAGNGTVTLMTEDNDVTNIQNYDISNYNYNFVNNNYNYQTINNVVFSVTNNYNNSTVIVNGDSSINGTYKYYYKLPDGSNSYNMTEEQLKGYRTDFEVLNYNDSFDNDNLISLFHFDGNKKDSAYQRPGGNATVEFLPETISYFTADNYNFGSYLYLGQGTNKIIINPSIGNHIDFRIFPTYSQEFKLSINDQPIFNRFDYVVSETRTDISTTDGTQIQFVDILIDESHVITPDGVCGTLNVYNTRVSMTDLGNGIRQETYRCGYDFKNTTTIPVTTNTTKSTTQTLYDNYLRYNEWNHISLLTDSSNIYIYINGIYIGSESIGKLNGKYRIDIEQGGYTYFDELRIKGTSFLNQAATTISYSSDFDLFSSAQKQWIRDNYSTFSEDSLLVYTSWSSTKFYTNLIFKQHYSSGSPGECTIVDRDGNVSTDNVTWSVGNMAKVDIFLANSSDFQYNAFACNDGESFNFDNFACEVKQITQYDVNVSINPSGGGTVVGAGTYDEGDIATLTATPNDGFLFQYWGGDVNGTGSTINVEVTRDLNVTAYFYPTTTEDTYYSITAVPSPINAGSISGTGNYLEGDSVTLIASPFDGYKFLRWDDGSINPSKTLTADNNYSFTAYFEELIIEHTLTVNQINTGEIQCVRNEINNYTCSFVPYSNYEFEYFIINGTNITSNPFTFDIVQDSTLTASTVYIGDDPDDPVTPPGTGDGPIYNFTPPSLPYDTNLVYTLPEVDTNNKILIQSSIPISDWQIGGVRPSLYSYGFVYIYVDENGLMKSIQQFDGADWIDLKGSLYSSYLNKWVNFYGYSIFFNTWNHTDTDMITPNEIDSDLGFFQFLNSWFTKIEDWLSKIFIAVNGTDTNIIINNQTPDTIIENNNNISNELNINIGNLTDLENDFKTDFDTHVNNIDLNTTDFSTNDNFVNSATFVTGVFNRVIEDNPIGQSLIFVLIVGFAMLLVGRRY